MEINLLFAEFADKSFDEVDVNPALLIGEMFNRTHFMTRKFITDPNIQALLKSDAKFDLVITELAMNEAVLGKCRNRKIKFILLSELCEYSRFFGALQVSSCYD